MVPHDISWENVEREGDVDLDFDFDIFDDH